eukprot:1149981-Pelagomonas_calceolata.AAC.4
MLGWDSLYCSTALDIGLQFMLFTHTSCETAVHAERAKLAPVNSANPCACPFFQFIWDAWGARWCELV